MMNTTKKLTLASLAYAVLLIAAVALTSFGVVSGFAALLVALVPLASGVFVVLAVRDYIVLGDELHRKIQLEALAIAMAGTFLILLPGSLLPVAGIPEPGYAWPLAAMSLLWALSQMFANLRYQ
jgi:drug/metabolite transporter (DMT)-like permease